MKQTFFIPILILAFSFAVFAQTSENSCPKIKINSPETVSPNEAFKVSASFENEAQPSTSKFNWTIIKGNEVSKTKESGIIEIDSKKMDEGGTIILLAESPDEKCQNTAMADVFILPVCGLTLTIDEYSKLDWNDERARLDNVAVSMKNLEDAELFIQFNFEKTASQGRKKERLIKVFKFLSETRGFEKKRMTIFISESDLESLSFEAKPKELSESYNCENCIVIRGEDLEKIVSIF